VENFQNIDLFLYLFSFYCFFFRKITAYHCFNTYHFAFFGSSFARFYLFFLWAQGQVEWILISTYFFQTKKELGGVFCSFGSRARIWRQKMSFDQILGFQLPTDGRGNHDLLNHVDFVD